MCWLFYLLPVESVGFETVTLSSREFAGMAGRRTHWYASYSITNQVLRRGRVDSQHAVNLEGVVERLFSRAWNETLTRKDRIVRALACWFVQGMFPFSVALKWYCRRNIALERIPRIKWCIDPLGFSLRESWIYFFSPWSSRCMREVCLEALL